MKTLILVLIVGIGMFSCKKLDTPRELPSETSKANFFPKQDNIPMHKPNEVVVKFKAGSQKKLLKGRMFTKTETATMRMAKFQSEPYYQVNVQDEIKALQEFKNDPEVESVSLNPTHTTQDIFVPNDPQYTGGGQWNLTNIEANKAWESGNTGSSTVYIAVLDEGAAYWFCDYNSKVWTNPEEMNGVTGVDDDLNGHIDDYRGWNYFDGSNQLYTGNDDHGTWCGSMIGAESGNNIRIASLAPNIKIIHYKFLADYGYDLEAAKAVDDIIWLKVNKGLNIVAISNSWGGGGPTVFLKDAIHRAALADINFVCAAGNNNQNTGPNPSYPAAYDEPNILSVGASDQANNRASFSNYGLDPITGVDLFAPGVNCAALVPINHQEGIQLYSGTSMATPLVAGAIGLLASVNPEMTYQQRAAALLATVKKTTSLTQYCLSGGILNLNNPVFFGNTQPVIPDATCGTSPILDTEPPSTMVLKLDSTHEDPVSGYAVLYISWTPPTDASEIPYLQFKLLPNWFWTFEGNAWTGWPFRVPMNALYQISGRAVDAWGNAGTPSNIIVKDYSGTPPPSDNIAPSIPANLRASSITTSAFTASWSASTDNVAMKDYKIHWRPIGNPTWTMTYTTNLSYRPTGLLTDTDYEFGVMARDQADNFSDTSIITLRTLSDVPPPVDITAPIVTITNPPNGYVIPQKGNKNINIQVSASDNVGVAKIQIFIDGVLKKECLNTTSCNYNWKTGSESSGQHTITAKAFDAAGNVDEKTITVIK